MLVETIKIKNPVTGEGYTIINKSEFNEKAHELFEAEGKDSQGGGTGELTATEIKAELDKLKVEYRGNASKADLKALLDEALKKAQDLQGGGTSDQQ